MTATFDRERAFDLIQAALHEYEAGDGFAVDDVVDALAACVAPDPRIARLEALCDASARAAKESQAAYFERTGYRNVMTPLLDVEDVRAILDGTS